MTDLHLKWKRLGVMFSGPIPAGPVDPEWLVVESLGMVRSDSRLFWCVASWLSVHHELIDTRRLGKLLDQLQPPESALAGALLEVALQQSPRAANLESLGAHCRPLRRREILFHAVERVSGAARYFEGMWLEEFSQWGFLHYQWTDKRDAIRPVRWLLKHAPELRYRAVIGAGQEAELLEMALSEPVTVAEVAKRLNATYASTHSTASRLVRRGLVVREGAGREVYLRAAPLIKDWFEEFPGA